MWKRRNQTQPSICLPDLSVAEEVRETAQVSLQRAAERKTVLEARKLEIESEINELNVVINALTPACQFMAITNQMTDALEDEFGEQQWAPVEPVGIEGGHHD